MDKATVSVDLNGMSIGNVIVNGHDISNCVSKIKIEACPLKRPKVELECSLQKLEACIDDPELLLTLKEGKDLDCQASNRNKKVFQIPTFLCTVAVSLLLIELLLRLF